MAREEMQKNKTYAGKQNEDCIVKHAHSETGSGG